MIIVIGASGGIGKFLYDELKKTKIRVLGTSFHNTSNSELSQLDVNDVDMVELFFASLPEADDYILINCSGKTYNSFAHKSDLKEWADVINTNLIGTFNCIRFMLPLMRKINSGCIINFGSVVAKRPTPGISAYAASKAALWGLSNSVSKENAGLNISINTINLGYSELGMIKEVPQSFLDNLINEIPRKSLCSKDDILETINYLIKCRYLTGSEIDLSGGLI